MREWASLLILVIELVLIAGALVSVVAFSRARLRHPDRSYPDRYWAFAHHLVVAGLVVLTNVVASVPAAVFGLADDGVPGKSATVISGAIVSTLLLPLTVAIGAVNGLIRKALWRRLSMVLIWGVSLGLLIQFVQSWLR